MGQKTKEENTDESAPCSGEFVFPNDDRYCGEYVTNADGVIERHGFGTHTTSKGLVYTGSWENDKMNGKGRLTFPSGAVYDGEFINNHYNGEGTYSWRNGCVYRGSFENSKLQGEGTFSDTHNQTWTGSFYYRAAPGLKFKLNL